MEHFETCSFIPVQKEGKNVDLEFSVAAQSLTSACSLYKTASMRLLYPYQWHELSGTGSAEFSIYGRDRNNVKPVIAGDHLVIDIPGTAILPADNHDWVIVEDIQEDVIIQADESIGLKLRASTDPHNSKDQTHHFFTESATSTLIIKRIDIAVTASYHGRNEKPNIETGNTVDNIRNGIVAFGALIGLSKLQWTALVKGILSD